MGLKLDPLGPSTQIAGQNGSVSGQFRTIWQKAMDALQAAYDGLAASVTNIENVLNGTQQFSSLNVNGVTVTTLGSLADQSTVNNNDWSGLDLAVVNGGTGASSAGAARTNLDVPQKLQSYGVPTGTLLRTTFATYSAPAITNPPTQAEVQAIADHLEIISRHVAALITDLD